MRGTLKLSIAIASAKGQHRLSYHFFVPKNFCHNDCNSLPPWLNTISFKLIGVSLLLAMFSSVWESSLRVKAYWLVGDCGSSIAFGTCLAINFVQSDEYDDKSLPWHLDLHATLKILFIFVFKLRIIKTTKILGQNILDRYGQCSPLHWTLSFVRWFGY